MNNINVLVLGESGVGKSTWINGIANYLYYGSLHDAEENDLVNLIPTSFTMTDEDYNEKLVKIGSDSNEVHSAGQAATQFPRTYAFNWNGKMVNLIDTPGIGDPRGIEKDKQNFDNILGYLANFDQLHGICILLKPNNARLTVMFRFGVVELLTHLHRSASTNIIFFFTNTRGTFYRPGNTLPSLRTLLSEKNYVSIPLNRETIYCMDNESYRFLCAIDDGITYSDGSRKNYAKSWSQSFEETDRLFNHFLELDPHQVKDTLSLNNSR